MTPLDPGVNQLIALEGKIYKEPYSEDGSLGARILSNAILYLLEPARYLRMRTAPRQVPGSTQGASWYFWQQKVWEEE